MNTTVTGEVSRPAEPRWPTLLLLYHGGQVKSGAGRAIQTGDALGRDVSEAEGIGLWGDARASRLHATVHLDPDGRGLRITDAGSKNGTWVNGHRIVESSLLDGDVVRIGDSFLLVRYQPATRTDAPIDLIVGTSPAVRALRSTIARIAPVPATVLLQGESGTGKEIAARALHQRSGRTGPFKAFNCSAIPESLAESQLFGHVKGAFTGASAQEGWFRSAQGGTLLLDEIGDLPPVLQPKLLRAIEEREVVPVGATSPVPCDVRLVAATNRDLPAEVQAGRFRGDLYARLAEIPLSLPPLRDRREDILPLLLLKLGAPTPRLSPTLVSALLLYPWPYNIRELFKIADYFRDCAAGAAVLDVEMVADRLKPPKSAAPGVPVLQAKHDAVNKDQARPRPDCEELSSLLRAHRGNITHIASAVGRSRKQVDRWLADCNLHVDSYRKQ